VIDRRVEAGEPNPIWSARPSGLACKAVEQVGQVGQVEQYTPAEAWEGSEPDTSWDLYALGTRRQLPATVRGRSPLHAPARRDHHPLLPGSCLAFPATKQVAHAGTLSGTGLPRPVVDAPAVSPHLQWSQLLPSHNAP